MFILETFFDTDSKKLHQRSYSKDNGIDANEFWMIECIRIKCWAPNETVSGKMYLLFTKGW